PPPPKLMAGRPLNHTDLTIMRCFPVGPALTKTRATGTPSALHYVPLIEEESDALLA
ncbi:hypothetical protein BaRGS_00015172, partial [Batillaria attramentaria]